MNEIFTLYTRQIINLLLHINLYMIIFKQISVFKMIGHGQFSKFMRKYRRTHRHTVCALVTCVEDKSLAYCVQCAYAQLLYHYLFIII